MPLIRTRAVVATRSALRFCTQHALDPKTFLQRHLAGDFGDICARDAQANADAIAYGGRVFSSYSTPHGDLWVITEADGSSTCLLRPDDY